LELTGHLFDTNSLIYYFSGLTDDEDLPALLSHDFRISIITKIEFLGWRRFGEDALLLERARDFLRHAHVFPLDDRIAEGAVGLRQRFRVKTPDAVIAATALNNDLIVITNNTQDFAPLGVKTRKVKLKQSG
jgi:predicted nucleic acid-binding protein